MSLLRALAPLGLIACFALSPAALAADTYTVDAVHSAAIFRVHHFGAGYTYGRFNDIAGSMVFDEADPTKTTVEITIKTASVDTHNEKRDTHLQSPDFFDAAQFPTMSFKSKKVAANGANKLKVTGDLTIHGVTREITVDVDRTGTGKDPWGGIRTGAEATLTIKRSDYGMSGMLEGIGDDVRLIVSLEGVKK